MHVTRFIEVMVWNQTCSVSKEKMGKTEVPLMEQNKPLNRPASKYKKVNGAEYC